MLKSASGNLITWMQQMIAMQKCKKILIKESLIYILEFFPSKWVKFNCYSSALVTVPSKPLKSLVVSKWRVSQQQNMNLEWFLPTVFRSRVLSVLSWLPLWLLHQWLMWTSIIITITTTIIITTSKRLNSFVKIISENLTLSILPSATIITTISTSIISMRLWLEISTSMNSGLWFLVWINWILKMQNLKCSPKKTSMLVQATKDHYGSYSKVSIMMF